MKKALFILILAAFLSSCAAHKILAIGSVEAGASAAVVAKWSTLSNRDAIAAGVIWGSFIYLINIAFQKHDR